MKADKYAVGQRIKKLRLTKLLTLEQFGNLFGCDKSIVYRWENGQTLPNEKRLEAIANYAGITVSELLLGNAIDQIYDINDTLLLTSKIIDAERFENMTGEIKGVIDRYKTNSKTT